MLSGSVGIGPANATREPRFDPRKHDNHPVCIASYFLLESRYESSVFGKPNDCRYIKIPRYESYISYKWVHEVIKSMYISHLSLCKAKRLRGDS